MLHIVNSSDTLLCGCINNLNGWTGQTDLCHKLRWRVPVCFSIFFGFGIGVVKPSTASHQIPPSVRCLPGQQRHSSLAGPPLRWECQCCLLVQRYQVLSRGVCFLPLCLCATIQSHSQKSPLSLSKIVFFFQKASAKWEYNKKASPYTCSDTQTRSPPGLSMVCSTLSLVTVLSSKALAH